MFRLDPEVARQGRAAMKERCIAAAQAETHHSITEIRYRSSLTGRAWRNGEEYIIVVPRPHTRRALQIYLHEVAHVILGHCDSGRRVKALRAWQRERAAEDWSFAAMRRHGIAVPRKAQQRAKRYVEYKKEQGRRCAHRHKWEDFPVGYSQRGKWERCSDPECTWMRPLTTATRAGHP